MTLVQTYSPVVAMHLQTTPCGPGEAYRPTLVDIVLGNREVVLRNQQGRVVNRGPAAQDLSSAPAGDYLDLPGSPLRPGCTYEKDFRHWFGGRKPSVYARVATDSEHPGKLVVQYWFYYTFNDFTNKHEGDWEMAQVDFDAGSPEEALKTGPYEIDLAQHAGGERGVWDHDRKLSKDGQHPVIYVATGAHAAYFESKLYLGTGGGAIFGCEDTRGPTTRLAVQPVVLPKTPVGPDSAFAWLNFRGRWGQKEAGINNGPLGPAYSDAWAHPISWAETLRTDSVVVPGMRALGVSVTHFFCKGVSDAAIALNWGLIHPAPFLAVLAIIMLAGVATARRTTWRPPDPRPIRAGRGGGQILRASRRLYRENLRTFIGIGLIYIPVAVLAGGVQWVLFHLTGVGDFVALDGRLGAGTVFLALLIGDVGGAVAAAAVTAAVAITLDELDKGRCPTAPQAYALAGRKARALAGATAWQIVISVLLVLTVIGIPFAIYRFIRTSLYTQTCVLDDRTAMGSLRASRALTRGRWWRTFAFTALVDVLVVLSGPILGILILLLVSEELTFIDITGSIVYALTVPYAAIALTLYCFELQARPAARKRS